MSEAERMKQGSLMLQPRPAFSDKIPRIYLDTNVFIRFLESPAEENPSLFRIMHLIEQGLLFGFTSEITLAEVLVQPYSEGDDALADSYFNLINSSGTFRLYPADRESIVRAARLRSMRKSLKLPDAMHLAAAELSECQIFLSNDKDIIPRAPMQRVGLDEQDLAELIDWLA